MGACSSCLSQCLGRRKGHESDHERLLSPENAYGTHGTFDHQRIGRGSGGETIDPQDVVREREALERIVTRASMSLIDIFALAPQPAAPQQLHHHRHQPSRSGSRSDIAAIIASHSTHSHSHSRSSSGAKTPNNKMSSNSNHQMAEAATATTTATTALTGPQRDAENRTDFSNGSSHPSLDTKRMAIYRALLSRTSPPQLPVMPEVLSPSVVSEEERNWLEQIGKEADEAVGRLVEIKGVGKLVVGLDLGESI